MKKLFATALLAGLGLGTLTAPREASAQDKLPNLQATPAHTLSVVMNSQTVTPELRLGATSWNSGAGPLELIASPGSGGQQDIYQRIYQVGGGYRDNRAGTFEWHPAHNHFHFERYALYTLRPAGASGQSHKESYKTSFCIMDTTKVDTSLPGASKKAIYTTCNADKQGMSVGWGDTYGAHLEGQAIDLGGLADGLYELTLKFDPSNQLLESNEADNTACSLLNISVTNRTVQVAGACGTSGAPSISSIDPTTIFAGTTIEVTITGANFYPGIAVGFENGSRPAPVPSNINVLDSGTIKATVSVRANGRGPDYLWDLRVGSAVLSNAFTVVP